MHTETYQVKGMHCASCSSVIEKTLKRVDGVQSVEVNYGTEKAKLSFDPAKTSPHDLSGHIEPLGYSLVAPKTAEEMGMSPSEHAAHAGVGQSKQDKLAEVATMKSQVVASLPLVVVGVVVMAWDALVQFGLAPDMPMAVYEFVHHLLPIMATYMLVVVGRPYLMGVVRFFRYGKANMDTLIGIGTSVAFGYSFLITALEDTLRAYINVEHTYYDVTIVVIAFITFGKYLEARAKIKTGDAIEKLLNLQAKTALVVRGGVEIEVPIRDVIHGDHIVVKPGARLPVDGVVREGFSFVDESMVTGEPMPSKKEVGDQVTAGTINTTGAFIFEATKVGSETLLARIIKMVEDAQGSRAPIQEMADKISGVFVPVVLVIAFLSLGAWLVIGTSVIGFSQALSFGLVSFVGVLIIACPCALGLATPTAIIVGVGKGAKEGILIKDAATLQKLHTVTAVVLDKTGTITEGKPTLVDMHNVSDLSDDELLSLLVSLEHTSEHPIAHAIGQYGRDRGVVVQEVSDFRSVQGRGLEGRVQGVEYWAGSVAFMTDKGVAFDSSHIDTFTAQGKTPVILAIRDRVLGFVMVADRVKDASKEAIANLHALGIRVVMLTGDDERAARYIASLVGIDEVVAHVLPQDKLAKIQELQSHGMVVAMAGDGVNDAPALAQADVGIAMGTGTDVAIEAAGITLLHGDISKLAKAIKLSKLTMRGIKQNLFWAFVYNVVGIPLAAGAFYPVFGLLLNPVFAGLAMALSSVSVVSNSLRIKAKNI